jgi:hypothetical protein
VADVLEVLVVGGNVCLAVDEADLDQHRGLGGAVESVCPLSLK